MFRFIEFHFQAWKKDPYRKPIILKGARQVGKTYAVRCFGNDNFAYFIEINFEEQPKLKTIFNQDQDFTPTRILRDLSAALKIDIIPGETLLFFDEIQVVPEVIIALRYFYEQMPQLHVIAAGSLLEFAIQQIGVPVGRVDTMYMYPMSWLEFLYAHGYQKLISEILNHDISAPESLVIHAQLLQLLKEYMAIGGMPQVVDCWVKYKDPNACAKLQRVILNAYRDDFHKYTKQAQIKYVELVFEKAIYQLGAKFKYSNLASEYKTRVLSPALDLLEQACVLHCISHSDGHGLPLGAQVKQDVFKIIFLDVGLSQAMLGLDLADWLLNGNTDFINKGSLTEAFVGQELLAYSNPYEEARLFFWMRRNEESSKSSTAEIDYLIQHQGKVVPVEVKSAKGNKVKSMQRFLQTHESSQYGILFSAENYAVVLKDNIKAYPLYAIARCLSWQYESFLPSRPNID